MSIPDSVELQTKSINKLLPDLARWYIIELGGQSNYLFTYLFPLNTLFNHYIQVCNNILVQPIIVNAEEHVIGGRDAISGEVVITC